MRSRAWLSRGVGSSSDAPLDEICEPCAASWALPPSIANEAQDATVGTQSICQALIPAAARITTPDSFATPRQLIRVDGAPVIIHILRGLQSSGILRTVITLGHAADLLVDEVRKHSFGKMSVEFVWCEASSWKRGHASNILAARSMFLDRDAPFLLVMSDHIFSHQLLQKLAATALRPGGACALIDDSEEMVEWAKPGGAHCQAHCTSGHCGSLVKVRKADGNRISRISKRLDSFDALEAGAYVVRPAIFDVLHQLLADSIYCTLAEAMQIFAQEGRLSYVTVDGLDWFSEQTVASLVSPCHSAAVLPEWRHKVRGAGRRACPRGRLPTRPPQLPCPSAPPP
jgi:choline kinase